MKRLLLGPKLLFVLGIMLVAAAPGIAFAHDGLGGDDYAVANWMFVGAMITIVIGLLWGLWAWRSGQFSNVEESKYRMLDLDDEYEQIMKGEEEPAEKEPVRTEERKPTPAHQAR